MRRLDPNHGPRLAWVHGDMTHRYGQAPDLERICEAATDARSRGLDDEEVLLAIFSGLRLGEILGLRWSDVELGRDYTAKWPKVAQAVFARHVRFHDLRHTCASHLVMGSWGRPWRLEEVRQMLGHSSITATERYAHLAPEVLWGLASETAPMQVGPRMDHELCSVERLGEQKPKK